MKWAFRVASVGWLVAVVALLTVFDVGRVWSVVIYGAALIGACLLTFRTERRL